jgi:hypothetical protein
VCLLTAQTKIETPSVLAHEVMALHLSVRQRGGSDTGCVDCAGIDPIAARRWRMRLEHRDVRPVLVWVESSRTRTRALRGPTLIGIRMNARASPVEFNWLTSCNTLFWDRHENR